MLGKFRRNAFVLPPTAANFLLIAAASAKLALMEFYVHADT